MICAQIGAACIFNSSVLCAVVEVEPEVCFDWRSRGCGTDEALDASFAAAAIAATTLGTCGNPLRAVDVLVIDVENTVLFVPPEVAYRCVWWCGVSNRNAGAAAGLERNNVVHAVADVQRWGFFVEVNPKLTR